MNLIIINLFLEILLKPPL